MNPDLPAGVPGVVPAIPVHLTPWGMFTAADGFVQMVMIVLMIASVASWGVLIAKSGELSRAKRSLGADLDRLGTATAIGDLAGLSHAPVTAMVDAARLELNREGSVEGVKERLSMRLDRIQQRASRDMLKGTTLLATIASAGPFVGLLGTVWGIMNAFIGIAQTKTTSLAVVAPGIAEALLATACGLVAAIPAVVIFNGFARAVAGYRGHVGDAASGVAVLTSHILDTDRR